MNFARIGFCLRSLATKAPTNLRGKSKSSQEWIARQLADPYVERAKVREIAKA